MNCTLSNFRKNKKMSSDEMADAIGVSSSFYSKVESGSRNPSYNFICKFLKAFSDTNVNEIFFNQK